jgi:hypothetical protein
MPVMRLDGAPSTSRIYARASPGRTGVTFYVEVAEVGVMVIPTESLPRDPRGRLYPQGAKLLSLAVLDRLAESQTPLPYPPSDPDPSADPPAPA